MISGYDQRVTITAGVSADRRASERVVGVRKVAVRYRSGRAALLSEAGVVLQVFEQDPAVAVGRPAGPVRIPRGA